MCGSQSLSVGRDSIMYPNSTLLYFTVHCAHNNLWEVNRNGVSL